MLVIGKKSRVSSVCLFFIWGREYLTFLAEKELLSGTDIYLFIIIIWGGGGGGTPHYSELPLIWPPLGPAKVS